MERIEKVTSQTRYRFGEREFKELLGINTLSGVLQVDVNFSSHKIDVWLSDLTTRDKPISIQ